MASKSRRQLGLLGALLAVLFFVLIVNRDPAPSGSTGAAPRRGQRQVVPAAPAREEMEVVRLDALNRPRPDPEAGARDPFRFRPAAPPPAPPPPAAGLGPGGLPVPPVPVGPPPPPPIALKFIGLVEQAPSRLKLAVLSDGRNVFYGKEGDTIEGRYRIERIGAESIDMAYIDGRGRQTLRLSGS
jgi:hypothetical protein